MTFTERVKSLRWYHWACLIPALCFFAILAPAFAVVWVLGTGIDGVLKLAGKKK